MENFEKEIPANSNNEELKMAEIASEEIKTKIKEKYFTGTKPESDFSSMGSVKIINDNVFFVWKKHHAPDGRGYKKDTLFVLDKDMQNKLFEYSGEIFDKYEDHAMNDPEKTYTKPENEFKEIMGIRGNSLEILNSKDEMISVELPENLLDHKE
jgi:hypothetical protein